MNFQAFLQNNLRLLQSYVLHPNKNEFLEKQLTLPQDRKLFDYLLNSLCDEEKQLIEEFGLSDEENRNLFSAKVYREMSRVKSEEDKTKIMNKIKELSKALTFDFPKPIDITQKKTRDIAQVSCQKIEQQNFETQATVKEVVARALNQNPDNFLKLTNYGLKNLPFELLSIDQEKHAQYFFRKSEVVRNSNTEDVVKLLSNTITKFAKQRKQQQTFHDDFCKLLSYEQIQAIKKLKPKLFQSYFQYLKLFQNKYQQILMKLKQTATLTLDQREEKLKICQEALSYVKNSNKDICGNLIEKLIEEILIIGEVNANSDISLFQEYLRNIKFVNYQNFENEFLQAKRQRYNIQKVVYYPRLTFLDSEQIKKTQIINKTIASLFKANNQDTLSRLSRFFNYTFLVKQQAKAKLALGLQSQITAIHDIFSANELKDLKQLKQITLLPTNKKKYKISDKVILETRIKNINKLTKKVYTIDQQKQLLEHDDNIYDLINLKFLIPQFQQNITFPSDDPFKQFKYQFEFQYLNQKLGDFIVELEGEGISSRAVIRKGNIFMRNYNRLTGHEIKFFDEEGKIINQLVIWRNKKRIEVKQKYDIPYGPQEYEKIIAVYRGHAEKFNIKINKQLYSFNCDYLYHSESFIVGNKARIILHPILKLNDTLIQISRGRNYTIDILSVNNQDIISSKCIENVDFKDNQDYVIQYPIKSYIKSLNITVNGQVQLIDKTIIKLNHSKKIYINLQENYDNFIDLYLQKNIDGVYVIKVRGKNGESISKAQINLSYQQFGIDMLFNKDLVTNSNGQVRIGKMLQVTKLVVKITQNGLAFTRTWKLNNYSDNISYGSEIDRYSYYNIYLSKDQNLILPIPCQINLENDVIFEYTNKGFYYNKISNIEASKDKLIINNLNIGYYTLYLLRFNLKIDINVIDGRQWQNDRVISGENKCLKLTQNFNNLISLGEIKWQIKNDSIQYSIDIKTSTNQLPKNLRLHVFAKNYIDYQNQQFDVTKKLSQTSSKVEYLQFRKSTYYSNKKLSDETAYVLNRKMQESTNGNNLQKPHIFLKRIQLQSTKELQEQLSDEEDYQRRKYERERICYERAPRCYYRSQNDSFSVRKQINSQFNIKQPSVVIINGGLNSHNNFLCKVGHLTSNLKKINSITVPKGYNQLVVYLSTSDVRIKRQYTLPDSKIEQLKLTHPSLKDKDNTKGWTMSREIYQIFCGNKFSISRNSAWTTFSLLNIPQYAKTKGIILPEWLISWKNYEFQKKLQIYDKQLSHELNFYLYRNDPFFFNSIVKPFISNKLQKTFVDYFLLDDKQELLKYARAHILDSLNSFQKAILVQKLNQYGKNKQAENLTNLIQSPFKNHKKSSQEFKVFFQTVLNAKQESTSTSRLLQAFSKPIRHSSRSDRQISSPKNIGRANEEFMYDEQCAEDKQQSDRLQLSCVKRNVQLAKQKYKQGFKQAQQTKEYVETTYAGLTNPSLSSTLVPPTQFWGQLARHYSSGTRCDFLSHKFSDFTQKIEFILAICVLPNQANADYEIENLQNSYEIEAKNSFLVFVREVKSVNFEQSKNVVLNQRFFDPKNRHIADEEGILIEKQISSFVIQKPYAVQTIITNISGSNLQLQLLIDIPQGSIPLLSHEQTQIINISLPAYNTKSFERQFYFPDQGSYSFYPANVSKGNLIISKAAQVSPLKVTSLEVVGTLETLDNILRSGNDEDILNFIKNKNIFDPNVFNINLILWKLKNKQFYQNLIKILKQRQFYNHLVWSFAFYHNCFDQVLQFIEHNKNQFVDQIAGLSIFEYYPYYSRRVHQFADENRSTIRVKQFRQKYAKFIFSGIFSNKTSEPYFILVHIYYLILQDRISEVKNLYRKLDKSSKHRFQIQYDYIDCFLDMYEGASTNYAIANQISSRYQDYPVKTWRKLFNDVYKTLNFQRNDDGDFNTNEEQINFSTTVVNLGTQIKINRPAHTNVIINFYEIDIELYFSQFAFEEISHFSAIKPTKTFTLSGNQFKVEKVDRKQCQGLDNVFVQIYQQKLNTAHKKLSSFYWPNPDIKVKISEKEGILKVLHNGKKLPSCYCKVYSRGLNGVKFSRDGYTDVASTFRYALDVKNITEFSILVLTDFGGSIHKVKAPSID